MYDVYIDLFSIFDDQAVNKRREKRAIIERVAIQIVSYKINSIVVLTNKIAFIVGINFY